MAEIDTAKGPRSLSLSEWPALDDLALPEEKRTVFLRRQLAVQAYARGESLSHIAEDCGVHRSTVLRLVRQGQQAHPDGRLWGYRALVPHVRVQPYERSMAPRVLVHSKAGNAGAFAQLLRRHPSLAIQLRRELEVSIPAWGSCSDDERRPHGGGPVLSRHSRIKASIPSLGC